MKEKALRNLPEDLHLQEKSSCRSSACVHLCMCALVHLCMCACCALVHVCTCACVHMCMCAFGVFAE